MLEFKFDTKISNYSDFLIVLQQIQALPDNELEASIPRESGPRLTKPAALERSLRTANVLLPNDPERAWRSLWNEILMYGLVYWDFTKGNRHLRISPAGQQILNGENIEDVLLQTFSRLQYPHPLKSPVSNLIPFVRSHARVVPVRRAARVLVELENRAKLGELSREGAFLTDAELYYIWSCPDWLELPDGDTAAAVDRIIGHRKGSAVPHSHLMTLANDQHWLSRLATRIAQLTKYFSRHRGSYGMGISLRAEASSNPLFVSNLLTRSSYFTWTETLTAVHETFINVPPTLYTAWGLYHGGVRGDEHLSLESILFDQPNELVSVNTVDDHEDFRFTLNPSVWEPQLNIPESLSTSRNEFIEDWIKQHWLSHSYSVRTLSLLLDAVQHRHILLQGPPGTGKTQLAEIVSEVFRTGLITSTATPDWSTADTIGGLSLSQTDSLQAVAKNGIVTEAILECGRAVLNLPTSLKNRNKEHTAVWLLIDEFNRAEIDKVFGGLFTALSSSESRTLDLPFQSDVRRKFIRIPKRFRILATANTLDKAYVNGISQALLRRFAVIEVSEPSAPSDSWDLQDEVQRLRDSSFNDYGAAAGSMSHEALVALSRTYDSDVREKSQIDALEQIYTAVRTLRYGSNRSDSPTPRVPIGTAQVIDALTFATHLIKQGDSNSEAASKAITTNILPQVDFLPRSQLERLATAFQLEGDDNSSWELERMADRLPQLV